MLELSKRRLLVRLHRENSSSSRPLATCHEEAIKSLLLRSRVLIGSEIRPSAIIDREHQFDP